LGGVERVERKIEELTKRAEGLEANKSEMQALVLIYRLGYLFSNRREVRRLACCDLNDTLTSEIVWERGEEFRRG
jgi:hypothetical protein